jgi:hypothetical protein
VTGRCRGDTFVFLRRCLVPPECLRSSLKPIFHEQHDSDTRVNFSGVQEVQDRVFDLNATLNREKEFIGTPFKNAHAALTITASRRCPPIPAISR